MQISNRSLPESVSSLVCIFTFELQSESSANMFYVFSYFRTAGLGIYEPAVMLACVGSTFRHLLIYKMLVNTWFNILLSVLYNI